MTPKPFDSRQMVTFLDCPARQAGELLGVSHQTVARWSRGVMLTTDQADAFAIKVRAHPAEIWSNWWAEAPLEIP